MDCMKRLRESGRDEEHTALLLLSLSEGRTPWTDKDEQRLHARFCPSCNLKEPKQEEDNVQPRTFSGRKRTNQSGSSRARKRVKTKAVHVSKHTPKKNQEASRVNKRFEDHGPVPPPAMPDAVKARIEAMGGTNISLVIQKRLYNTDVGTQQNSLSIPFSQLFNKSHEFLTDGEQAFLSSRDGQGGCNTIKAPLLDTRMEIFDEEVCLRKWDMSKESGASSKKYVFSKPWIRVVKSNELESGNVIQVWAFRVAGRLNLALVKVVP